MNANRKIVLILVAVVLGAVVIAVLVKYKTNSGSNQQVQQAAAPAQEIGKKQDAPNGQLVQGFPQELATVDNSLTVNSSYHTPYKESNQYTTNFESTNSIATEYNNYLKFLTDKGYTIVNKTLTKDIGAIYGTSASNDVNFQASTFGGKTSVTVTYLQKQP
jgi:hypothetical protein